MEIKWELPLCIFIFNGPTFFCGVGRLAGPAGGSVPCASSRLYSKTIPSPWAQPKVIFLKMICHEVLRPRRVQRYSMKINSDMTTDTDVNKCHEEVKLPVLTSRSELAQP